MRSIVLVLIAGCSLPSALREHSDVPAHVSSWPTVKIANECATPVHLVRGVERWNVPAAASVDQLFADRDVLWIVDDNGGQLGSLEVDNGDDTITINADCHTMYAK
jgi:hypothetical protein